MRYYLFIFLLFGTVAYGQVRVGNLDYFKDFFESDSTSELLIIGESHSSAAGSEIYFPIVKYLNKTTGLYHLLIEFGPSEAYFYNQYLKTGNEKYLGYTIYAGFYKGWREAWKKIYGYQKQERINIQVSGIDFDRTRTIGYALYNIFKSYTERPDFINTLMDEIKSADFFKTYTIGYPTHKDLQWADSTKILLSEHLTELKSILSTEDFHVINAILSNEAVNYAIGREMGIVANVEKVIEKSQADRFMLMIGRDHAYYHHPFLSERTWLAQLLKEQSPAGLKVLSGLMLFENSELVVNTEKSVRLFEVRDKQPWKKYDSQFTGSMKGDITVVPLENQLAPLSKYADYVIIVQNQPGYEVINKK